jgi:DNA-binding MarR family transcriptional regulator
MFSAPAATPLASSRSSSTQPAGSLRAQHVGSLGDSLSRLLRTFNRARSQFLLAAEHDVDWSAHVLISQLVNEGPLRVGALAGCVRSDASTVSRQVAAMVKDGLIERRADPVDGRASLLVATDKARAIYARHNEIRNAHFARILQHWSARDCQQFAALLARFTEDFEDFLPPFPVEASLGDLPTVAGSSSAPTFSREES